MSEMIGDVDGLMVYDLILLDFSMPQMDGPATAKAIRELLAGKMLAQPYICCCSSYSEETFVDQAYTAGMDNFLTKPVNSTELNELCERLNLKYTD